MRGLKSARMKNLKAKPAGAFKTYQKVYFDSSEDSDCEDGRAPKGKRVRLDVADASMQSAEQNAAQSEAEGMEVKLSYKSEPTSQLTKLKKTLDRLEFSEFFDYPNLIKFMPFNPFK